jgi:hypothetical protein
MKTPPDFYIEPDSTQEKHLLKAGASRRFRLALDLNSGSISREEYEAQVALTYMPGKNVREMTAAEAKAALAKLVAGQEQQRRDKRNAADLAALEKKHATKSGNAK